LNWFIWALHRGNICCFCSVVSFSITHSRFIKFVCLPKPQDYGILIKHNVRCLEPYLCSQRMIQETTCCDFGTIYTWTLHWQRTVVPKLWLRKITWGWGECRHAILGSIMICPNNVCASWHGKLHPKFLSPKLLIIIIAI
jgi:hypothetical protein